MEGLNEVENIIKSGIKEATKIIAEKPQYVIPILSALIIKQTPLDEFFEWSTHFCLGGELKTRCKELEKEGKFYSKMCNKVWGISEIAYRCYTCGIGPSSSICVSCFKHGDHLEHDFVIYSSGFGGSCDCGNTNCWKPSGNCQKHSKQIQIKSIETDPILGRNRSCSITLQFIIQLMIRSILKEVNRLEDTRKIDEYLTSNFIFQSLNWITKLASASDPLRTIVGNQLLISYQNSFHFEDNKEDSVKLNFHRKFLSHLSNTRKKVEQEIKEYEENKSISFLDGMGCWLPHSISDSLSFLYLQLFYDQDFQRKFVKLFVVKYPRFHYYMSELDYNDKFVLDDYISRITTQMWYLPELVIALCRGRSDFIGQSIESLFSIFTLGLGQSNDNNRSIDIHHTIFQNNTYWSFLYDLYHAISLEEVAKIVLFERKELFISLLHCFQLATNIHPFSHQKDVHCEFEHQIRDSTNLETSIVRLFQPLFKTLQNYIQQLSSIKNNNISGNNDNNYNNNNEDELNDQEINNTIKELIEIIGEQLNQYFEMEKFDNRYRKFSLLGLNSFVEAMDFNILDEKISVHIPLIRFLGGFLQTLLIYHPQPEILFKNPNNNNNDNNGDIINSNNIIDNSSVNIINNNAGEKSVFSSRFLTNLMEFTLRIQILKLQIRSGLWNRNGLSFLQQVIFNYTKLAYFPSKDLDFAGLQSICQLMQNNDHFVTIILDRFQLFNFEKISNNNEEISDELRFKFNEDIYKDSMVFMIRESLYFLINLITYRFECGMDADEKMIYEIIHFLFIPGNLKYSQIEDHMKGMNLYNESFPAILEKVSTITMTDSTEKNYSINTDYWKYFDPFYPKYYARERLIVIDRYKSYLEANQIKDRVLPTPVLYNSILNQLNTLIESKSLLYYLFIILNHYNDLHILSSLLYLLNIAFLTPENSNDDEDDVEEFDIYNDEENQTHENLNFYYSQGKSFHFTFREKIKFSTKNNLIKSSSILLSLIKHYKNADTEDIKGSFKSILLLIAKYSEKNRRIILHFAEEIFGDHKKSEDGKQIDKKKELARKRQREILLRFKNAQMKFSSSLQEEIDEDSEGSFKGSIDSDRPVNNDTAEEESYDGSNIPNINDTINDKFQKKKEKIYTCCLCHDSGTITEFEQLNQPIGLLGLIQRSNILVKSNLFDRINGQREDVMKKKASDWLDNTSSPSLSRPSDFLNDNLPNKDNVEDDDDIISDFLNGGNENSNNLLSGESLSENYENSSKNDNIHINENNSNDKNETDNENNEIDDNEKNRDQFQQVNREIMDQLQHDEEEDLPHCIPSIPGHPSFDQTNYDNNVRLNNQIKANSLSKIISQFCENELEKEEGNDIRCCGHAIHMDCLYRYFMNLLNYEADYMKIPAVPNGEFFCPSCRRLCNSVFPLISSSPYLLPVSSAYYLNTPTPHHLGDDYYSDHPNTTVDLSPNIDSNNNNSISSQENIKEEKENDEKQIDHQIKDKEKFSLSDWLGNDGKIMNNNTLSINTLLLEEIDEYTDVKLSLILSSNTSDDIIFQSFLMFDFAQPNSTLCTSISEIDVNMSNYQSRCDQNNNDINNNINNNNNNEEHGENTENNDNESNQINDNDNNNSININNQVDEENQNNNNNDNNVNQNNLNQMHEMHQPAEMRDVNDNNAIDITIESIITFSPLPSHFQETKFYIFSKMMTLLSKKMIFLNPSKINESFSEFCFLANRKLPSLHSRILSFFYLISSRIQSLELLSRHFDSNFEISNNRHTMFDNNLAKADDHDENNKEGEFVSDEDDIEETPIYSDNEEISDEENDLIYIQNDSEGKKEHSKKNQSKFTQNQTIKSADNHPKVKYENLFAFWQFICNQKNIFSQNELIFAACKQNYRNFSMIDLYHHLLFESISLFLFKFSSLSSSDHLSANNNNNNNEEKKNEEMKNEEDMKREEFFKLLKEKIIIDFPKSEKSQKPKKNFIEDGLLSFDLYSVFLALLFSSNLYNNQNPQSNDIIKNNNINQINEGFLFGIIRIIYYANTLQAIYSFLPLFKRSFSYFETSSRLTNLSDRSLIFLLLENLIYYSANHFASTDDCPLHSEDHSHSFDCEAQTTPVTNDINSENNSDNNNKNNNIENQDLKSINSEDKEDGMKKNSNKEEEEINAVSEFEEFYELNSKIDQMNEEDLPEEAAQLIRYLQSEISILKSEMNKAKEENYKLAQKAKNLRAETRVIRSQLNNIRPFLFSHNNNNKNNNNNNNNRNDDNEVDDRSDIDNNNNNNNRGTNNSEDKGNDNLDKNKYKCNEGDDKENDRWRERKIDRKIIEKLLKFIKRKTTKLLKKILFSLLSFSSLKFVSIIKQFTSDPLSSSLYHLNNTVNQTEENNYHYKRFNREYNRLKWLLKLPRSFSDLFDNSQTFFQLADLWIPSDHTNNTVNNIYNDLNINNNNHNNNNNNNNNNHSSLTLNRNFSKKLNIKRLRRSLPFEFVKLPKLYQNLYQRIILLKCAVCKRLVERPGICLLCGQIICCGPSHLPFPIEKYDAFMIHAESCGAGVGVFLLLQNCFVLILRQRKFRDYFPLYLDKFGEKDFDLRRGKALYLSSYLYDFLLDLYLSQGFDHDQSILELSGKIDVLYLFNHPFD